MATDHPFIIPERLRLSCLGVAEREDWLSRLPAMVRELSDRWSLTLGEPRRGAACSWVAPARRPDGTLVAFKVGMPHLEAEQEIAGLGFWDGNPTVRLLAADETKNAMVLEWCDPDTSLRSMPPGEQDDIIAGLLRRLWRAPTAEHGFRHLQAMTTFWCEETRRDSASWPDSGLVREGIRAFEELASPSGEDVLLATDLHAGNVLRAAREPWLVIDPKPFVGDVAYDATQHLFNRGIRTHPHPERAIRDFAGILGVDPERVRLWTFARAAAEPRAVWDEETTGLARRLSP